MKITKRRTGFTIRLNDSEFEMLAAITDMTPADALKRGLKGNAKGAYTRRIKGGDLLRVDADTSTAARGTIHQNFRNQPAPPPQPA